MAINIMAAVLVILACLIIVGMAVTSARGIAAEMKLTHADHWNVAKTSVDGGVAQI